MSRLYVDSDRYGEQAANPLVEAIHSAVRDLARRKLQQSGGDWRTFVFGAANELITQRELQAIEAKLLETGYRFACSALISARERPEAYKTTSGVGDDLAAFSFEHPDAVVAPPDAGGREQRGVGDNVVKHARSTSGVARYIRSSERVLQLMNNGVPQDTIAIIDDSGGTLTAPILEKFKAVICAGGTVRSHLGILTREYGIPCLMNARISGIREGDRIEIESDATAKTAAAYQQGREMTARVWRLHG